LFGRKTCRIVDGKNKDWFGMKSSPSGELFVFHKDWIEVVEIKNSSKKIEIPEGCTVSSGGLLLDKQLKDISFLISQFNRHDDDTGLRIQWPDIRAMAQQDPSAWNRYHIGTPCDIRYRDYTMKKYGIRVPDKLLSAMSASAKSLMTVRKNVEISVLDKQKDTVIIRITSKEDGILNTTSVINMKGWLVIYRKEELSFSTGYTLLNALGNDKYVLTTMNVDDNDCCETAICIHRKEEIGPLETSLYALKGTTNETK
jgi:hypothetical protein